MTTTQDRQQAIAGLVVVFLPQHQHDYKTVSVRWPGLGDATTADIFMQRVRECSDQLGGWCCICSGRSEVLVKYVEASEYNLWQLLLDACMAASSN